MDIIDVSPDDLWVPADSLNGRLGEMLGGDCHSDDEALGPIYDINDGWRARDALRRVLAAGERCFNTECVGGFLRSNQDLPDDCPVCMGGDNTQPHDLGHFIDAEIAGRITPLAAAGLMWASVLRVEAGLRPVRAVLNPWQSLATDHHHEGRRALTPKPCPVIHDEWEAQKWIGAPVSAKWTHRAELGIPMRGKSAPDLSASKLAADTAALSTGFALLNVGEVLLPLDGGKVARLWLECGGDPRTPGAA